MCTYVWCHGPTPCFTAFPNSDLVSRKLSQIGFTPLHCAAQKGHADVARLLLDAGARLVATSKVRTLRLPQLTHLPILVRFTRFYVAIVCFRMAVLRWLLR